MPHSGAATGNSMRIRLKNSEIEALCTVENCDTPTHAKNMCNKHYRRFKKTLSTNPTRADRENGGKLKIGDVVGRLTLLQFIGKHPNVKTKDYFWMCKCSCGNLKTISYNNLIYKRTLSCGCLIKEGCGNRFRTHGLKQHSAYSSWKAMIDRCDNPANKYYKDYGGRGITVDSSWYDVRNFVADMGNRPPKYTLERKNNNQGYSKTNCVWATCKEQSVNRRTTIKLKYRKEIRCVSHWAVYLDIPVVTFWRYVKKGFSVSEIIRILK